MAGILQSSRKNHEDIIRAWMETIAKDGGIDRYDDLHVDRIDAYWKLQEHWVSAGLESFELAVRIRDAEKSDLTVVLAFSLEPSEFPKGLNVKTLEELEGNFDATPPSLYLFRPGTEFWTQTTKYVRVDDINWQSLWGDNHHIKKCLYMEFKRPTSEDYTRSIFVAG
jgi:hypothetical protein